MRSLKETFVAIPSAWKAVFALGMALFLGIQASGWADLPERMEDVEDRVGVIEQELDKTQVYLDIILCNQNPEKTWDQCQLEHGRALPR